MSTNTEWLEKQAQLLFDNVYGWEQRTLQYIGARIKKTGKMSMADVRQLNNMAVITQDMDAIIKDLAGVTGYNISELEKIYGAVIESEHNASKVLFDYRNEPFVPLAENIQLQALVKAYSRTTGETMINLSKTKALGFVDETGAFKSVKDTLYEALGKATMEVATGTTDFNTAMRKTIETIGGSGIRVNYGSGITRRLDTVVRQNILWGAKQASKEYHEMIGEQLDCDGIEIDWHSNPRPDHEFMQGKQYSLNGKKTVNGVTYESADRALEALEDYGCLHFKTSIILGVSEPAYSPEQLRELNRKNSEPIEIDGVTKTKYFWKQSMRQLETEARKSREQITLAKAAGNKDLERKYRQRLKSINTKYTEIADATGIKAQPEKMRVYGKTVGKLDSKNSVAKSVKGDIIESVRKNKAVSDVHSVGKLNRDIYSCVTRDIVTDEVIITDERIQHIKERHPNDFERYSEYIRQAIETPDYILEANKPNTAFILKSIVEDDFNFQVILRLATSNDPKNYKNSVITFLKVEEKRYNRYLRTKKILYKSE